MEAIIFIFYLFIVSYSLTKIPFFKNAGVGKWTLIALFVLKVIAGLAYARFYRIPRYYKGSDTWRFYRLSLEETKVLLKSPYYFLKDLFVYGYSSPGNVLAPENSYWNDLKSNVPVKIMAVMNVCTNNSYYADIILFNFLFLFGIVALFKVFDAFFPGKKRLIIIGLFFFPSTLFWCSGVHKDGLILSAAGLIIYSFSKISSAGFSYKHFFCIVFNSILIFSLRNYVLFALLPALFAWGISLKFPDKSIMVFLSIYLLGGLLFFALPFMFPSINFPLYLSLKQRDFLTLEGSSAVQLPFLIPTFKGFIAFLPYAVDMAFFRPHLSEVKNFSYIPAAVEVIIFILLIISSVFSIKRQTLCTPFILFLLFFSLSTLLICGYTVPYSGAIVRYRSLVLPLLITPLLCLSGNKLLAKV